MQYESSELVLNSDGSIFHLHLKPEHLADTVILVGDPGRVAMVSDFFDKVEYRIQNREFHTHTGYLNNKRLSVVSTGIGTDNIDIVLNELDAVANIDLKKRIDKKEHQALNLIRIGTSGALQEYLPVDSPVISSIAAGFDGMLNFYSGRNDISDLDIEKEFYKKMNWDKQFNQPYFVHADQNLISKLGQGIQKGITISAPGFYGPQGRRLRLGLKDAELNNKLKNFSYNSLDITNYEMESSAIYGLSKLLNHQAVTICMIIANRIRKSYSSDYKLIISKLVNQVLERIVD